MGSNLADDRYAPRRSRIDGKHRLVSVNTNHTWYNKRAKRILYSVHPTGESFAPRLDLETPQSDFLYPAAVFLLIRSSYLLLIRTLDLSFSWCQFKTAFVRQDAIQ